MGGIAPILTAAASVATVKQALEKPKIPSPPSPPPIVKTEPEQLVEQTEKEVRRKVARLKKEGTRRFTTLLTSARGVTSPAPVVRKSLLGE